MKDNVHVCDSRTIPNIYEPAPPEGLGANYSGYDSDMGLTIHQVDFCLNMYLFLVYRRLSRSIFHVL